MRKALRWILTALTLTVCLFSTRAAPAEDGTVWVLCNPENYVNIRETPSKKGHLAGYAYCGDDFRTDGVVRHGFLHVFAGTEMGDGWISTGFIVYCKPQEVGETWVIDSNGRVAARSTIGGSRNKWLRKGKEITVYYVAEYAVTNYGFVDARYVSPLELAAKD